MITRPPPRKLTHVQARYGVAHGGDRCGSCQAYRGRNDCLKVAPPIAAGGWCAVGVSLGDGRRFDPRGEAIERRFLGRDRQPAAGPDAAPAAPARP